MTKMPMPGRAATRPRCSSSLYALSTVFGLIARLATTSFTVGSWSPTSRSAEPQRVADLLDDLLVGRDARALIEMELDHC